jgi:dipeptidyl aminopeptidase/acylaminoacyl peptidase
MFQPRGQEPMRKHTVALSLALFFAAAQLSPAQTAPPKRPMTFEDMMHMKRLGETAVSPDGRWLAYAVMTVNLDQNTKTTELWLQAIGGVEPLKLAVAQPGDSGPQFASDGKRILFLSSRLGAQQVWIADFDGETGSTTNPRNPEMEPQLRSNTTDNPPSYLLDEDNARWSPDGKSIVFTAEVYPDCPAIGPENPGAAKCTVDRDAAQAASKVKAQIFTHLLYRHWNHYTGEKRSHLFLVSVENGAVRDLTPNDPHDVPPEYPTDPLGCGCAFAPDSKELAFTENLDPEPAISTNADIFALDLTNPAAKPVKVSTSPGGDFNPAYSPDGKFLAWRSQARAGYESDKFRLMLYDRAKKTIWDLLPNLQTWVDEFVWGPDSKRLLLVTGQRGEAPLHVANLEGHSNGLGYRGELSGLHPLGDGVTHLNDALLAQLDLPPMESFWFTAADKTKVQGFLIKPPAFDPAKKYPVKFLIHGGPQGAWGDMWSYRWNAELFAANGYVVVMINPRGSTGYGQAFVDGVNGDWGGKPFTDLMRASTTPSSTIPSSTRRASAPSAPAMAATWPTGCSATPTASSASSRTTACSTPSRPLARPKKTGSTSGSSKAPWDYYGKPDSENPFRKWSPSLSAKNFKTPTLVVHGQLDYRLDVSEGFQLFDTLQLLKVPSKMLYFPDEGHWVLKPQNSPVVEDGE